MKIIIVGHHSRIDWVAELQRVFPDSAATVDYSEQGAAAGHLRALQLAAQLSERTIIMEDDALPVAAFEALAERWFKRMPDELISFYLGTGRPPQWQERVDRALRNTHDDFISLPKLIHGVCYSIPPHRIGGVLDRLTVNSDEGIDFAIGRAWGNRPIIYPVESLVEHRDGAPVERHPDGQRRVEARVARNLAGPLIATGDL